MTPAKSGSAIAVTNRQRRLQINGRLLAQVAESALVLLKQRATPPHSQARGGQSFRLPALQDLSVVVVNDAAMAKLNTRYHATPGPTDILTFDYGAGQGELVISIDRVVANAQRFRCSASRELARYIVHGILHLHGFADQTAPQRHRMRAAERRLLNRVAQSVHLTGLVQQ